MEMMMDTGHTAAQLRGDTPLPIYPRVEVWKYNLVEPLVRPADLVIKELPTQMFRLHKWYMEATKQGRARSLQKIDTIITSMLRTR